jgi:large subunit ribosomal protein L9
MEVILLEKIQNLGELGDKVRVKSGYGRNYLLPQKKAVRATPDNIEKFEAQRAELEKAQAAGMVSADRRAEQLRDLAVTVAAKAGPEGKLYGSVGTADIAAAINAAGHELEKHEVRLPSGPLRELGEHAVGLHLHADVDVTVNVTIIADDAEPVVSAD